MSRTSQPEPRRRPTLKDVAVLAEVSMSTASLVFSGKGPVAPATAERVRQAATDLGYAGPNPLASSLRHGRVGTVAVLLEGRVRDAFRDPFAITVLDGIAEQLDTAGTAILLLPRSPDESDGAVEQLTASAFDAAIFALCGHRHDAVVDLLAARGIPMVGTGSPEDPRVPRLRPDERGACAAAARHLQELGHRNVAHVLMPLRFGAAEGTAEFVDRARIMAAELPDSRDRALGFLDVYPHGALAMAARADVECGQAAGRLVLAGPERPTAVVAQSDLLAAGVIRAAREAGLRVPEDLSVTGFDGVELPWLDAQLTTIVQDGAAKGRRLAAMVQDLLAGRAVHDEHLATSLRVGATTAPPP